jgi:glucose/arabinose dehydrogenase
MLADSAQAQQQASQPKTRLPLYLLKLPKGFKINLYADKVPGARQLALGEKGIVYVGTRGQGKVYALIPNKAETHTATVLTLADNLNEPNGIAFNQGSLYVAEIHQVLKYPDITRQLVKPPKPRVINGSFPNRRWHGYKYIKFGPDGDLYIAVGMPCNTCNYRQEQPMFGTIMRMKPDGKELTVYAKGVRNSVGFDWHPVTQVLWFTDNGQDLLGDDLPPDEINRAPRAGMDFGFPFYYGNNVIAPGYNKKDIPPKAGMTIPAYNLPAHVAALGLTFYHGKAFPESYQQQMFIAEHGSWNRSSKIGYQVIYAKVKDGKVTEVKPFISGWLQGQSTWGRPVDLLTMPDGSLLISDDYAGVIYRVSYQKE